MREHPIEILMAEQNPADARLTRQALREAKLTNNLTVVPDGQEALAYLRREGKYARAPRPDLVLLDWNLPPQSGSEVLAQIKLDPALRWIPVVVLTASYADEDIVKAHELQASCYLTKPVGFEQLVGAVQSIEEFWFTIVKRPAE